MKKPLDQFHYHEAMDRVMLMQDQMENALRRHPVLVADPRMVATYNRAMDAMDDLRGQASAKCLKRWPKIKINPE